MTGSRVRTLAFAVAVAVVAALSGAGAVAWDYSRSGPSAQDLVANVAPNVDSPEQQSAFADGVVTFDEYRDAVFAHVECLEHEGFVVATPPTLDSERQRYDYRVEFHGGPGDGQVVQQRSHDCYTRHLTEIDKVWSAANAPGRATLEDAQFALASCLRDNGIDAPVNPGPGALNRFMGVEAESAALDCAAAVADEFNLPGFAGY